MTRIGQIDGLSISTGLERVDGQRDVYKKTLKLTIFEIEKSEKNLPRFLAADDMLSFGIEVHGIKGVMASIGAMDLSATAYELEAASDKGDEGFCNTHLCALLDGLNDLNVKLKEAFSVISHTGELIELPPELPLILEKLLCAFDDVDLELVDEEMAKLNALNLDGALEVCIERIKDMATVMDYYGAAEKICELQNMCE